MSVFHDDMASRVKYSGQMPPKAYQYTLINKSDKKVYAI